MSERDGANPQDMPRQPPGSVVLVGAGPGDPELLTLKAVRTLREADVILYDALVSPEILSFARREARRLLVGKTGYGPSCSQTEINGLLTAFARAGRRVVRLKAGDPMIFARANEEIAELERAGIPVEVVPGISAVQGAAAALKVSLTDRNHAQRFQLITGHASNGALPETFDWPGLTDPSATTAVYMPKRTLAALCERLLAHGLDPACPAVAVFDATRPTETVVVSTVARLPSELAAIASSAPCVVVFGEVLQIIDRRRNVSPETGIVPIRSTTKQQLVRSAYAPPCRTRTSG